MFTLLWISSLRYEKSSDMKKPQRKDDELHIPTCMLLIIPSVLSQDWSWISAIQSPHSAKGRQAEFLIKQWFKENVISKHFYIAVKVDVIFIAGFCYKLIIAQVSYFLNTVLNLSHVL